jgi:hypothetical protein
MKLRSVILRLALATLLVFSQLVATAHAVEHLSAPSSSSSHHESLPNEQACHQCLAFLSLGSALPGSTNYLPVDLAAHVRPLADRIEHFTPACIRHFESRAPPAVLS